MIGLGALIPTMLGAAIAWFRYRGDFVEYDDREVYYAAGGNRIWGGNWAKLRVERRGIRRYLVDEQGRSLHTVKLLQTFFHRDDDLVLKLRAVTVVGAPKRPSPAALIISLAALILGIALLAVSLPRLRDMMAEANFAIDQSSVPIIVCLCAGVLMFFGGLLMSSLVGMAFAVKEEPEKSVVWRPGAPVEMEPGQRYRYRNREELKKSMMPGWAWLACFSPFIIGALALPFLQPPPGSDRVPLLVGILIAAAFAWGAGFLYRYADFYLRSLTDTFEITRNGELVVHRGSESRTLTRRPAKPRSFTHDSRFLHWSETYQDANGTYRLDRRYLEVVPVR